MGAGEGDRGMGTEPGASGGAGWGLRVGTEGAAVGQLMPSGVAFNAWGQPEPLRGHSSGTGTQRPSCEHRAGPCWAHWEQGTGPCWGHWERGRRAWGWGEREGKEKEKG